MAAYSFLNVQGAISGPGGAFNLGSGSGASEEGVKTSMTEEKGVTTPGADGQLMQTLRASNVGKMSISLLKTSRANALLSNMYNFQKGNPALWGTNVITISDVARGDVATLTQAAFVKLPDVQWAKDGNMIEWEFTGNLDEQLGQGVPDVNV
jgi:hypothetical protein